MSTNDKKTRRSSKLDPETVPGSDTPSENPFEGLRTDMQSQEEPAEHAGKDQPFANLLRNTLREDLEIPAPDVETHPGHSGPSETLAEPDAEVPDDLISARLVGDVQDKPEEPVAEDEAEIPYQEVVPEVKLFDDEPEQTQEQYAQWFLTGALKNSDAVSPQAPEAKSKVEAPPPDESAFSSYMSTYLSQSDNWDVHEDENEPSKRPSAMTSRLESPVNSAPADDWRSVALEGYQDETVNTPAKSEKKGGASQRTEMLLTAILIVLIIAVLGGGGFFLWNRYTAAAVPTPTPVLIDGPYPLKMTLTGGWSFDLNPGTLGANGEWRPAGPEWLNGTSIRRLVALPWNRQLEAVVKSLEPGDQIQLLMSNTDLLVFSFQKLDEVTVGQTDILKGNNPALIIILSRPGEDTRLIITSNLIPATELTPTP